MYSKSNILISLALIFSYHFVVSDKPYREQAGNGCAGPFPPGHYGMGPSWFAIGVQNFNASLESIVADIHVPDAPTVNGSVSIIPSLEDTVSTDSMIVRNAKFIELRRTFRIGQTLVAPVSVFRL